MKKMKKVAIVLVAISALLLLASCATKIQEKDLMIQLKEAAAYIKDKMDGFEPEIGLILGSGLGDIAESIENPIYIEYKDIPNFPVSTAPTHRGRLVIGTFAGRKVICMQGRFHYYEGYEMYQTAFPVQVMRLLGVEKLIITNSAGCVEDDWEVGSLMLITDHIKFTAENPLRGPVLGELGERFFSMETVYDKDFQKLAIKKAEELGIDLKQGVYMYFAGPNFETPAEIRMADKLGADAVGMSTVPEVIAAANCGMRVLGFSCMTNMAAGIEEEPVSQDEILAVSERVRKQFAELITVILSEI